MKKLLAGVIFGVLTMAGAATVALPSASAGARHVASYPPTQAANLPLDQVIIIHCASLNSLQGDVGRLDNYRKGMAPAGAWIEDVPGHNTDWMSAGQFDAQFRSLVCVVVTVTPPRAHDHGAGGHDPAGHVDHGAGSHHAALAPRAPLPL